MVRNDFRKYDNNTKIDELKKIVESFIDKRDWEKYHTPRNIAESICIESAELLQTFQWMDSKESIWLKK